jgi:hypothetical protein
MDLWVEVELWIIQCLVHATHEYVCYENRAQLKEEMEQSHNNWRPIAVWNITDAKHDIMPHKVITSNITKEMEKNAYTENEEQQNYRKKLHYIVILNQLQLDRIQPIADKISF